MTSRDARDTMLQLVAAVFLVIVTAELGGSSVITAPSIRRRQSGCVGNLKSFQVGVTYKP